MDIFSFCKRQQLTDISDVDVDEPVFSRGAGVTGCDVNTLNTFVLGEAPSESVFAAAGADDK
jgi:hypothetical protein